MAARGKGVEDEILIRCARGGKNWAIYWHHREQISDKQWNSDRNIIIIVVIIIIIIIIQIQTFSSLMVLTIY